MVHDISGVKKWNKIPKKFQEKLICNVFCAKCGNVKIVDYSIYNDKYGIILKGFCEKCGSSVARFIEDN